MEYRKKPVIIEAVPVSEILRCAGRDWKALPEWVKDNYESGKIVFTSSKMYIKTLEGDHEALSTDMLIRGIQGEIYPCKSDIFEQTYEKVV